jgi:uncharacterized protein (DUF1800 family)
MLTPLPAAGWNFKTAAHLLNRSGFGGLPEEIEAAREAGLEAVVEQLLHPPDEPEKAAVGTWTHPDNLRSELTEVRGLKADPEKAKEKRREVRIETRDELLDLRTWWLERMLETRAPLREKMTLFWHGHFATSAQKVRNAYWMWRQNETLRRNALGNFKILLHEISRDPAMMIYLDLAQSRREHPNENWAREVMELFTLGIGQYAETDIRESARAFTGYRINLTNQQFRFEPRQHDAGWKSFMGQSGNFSGDDILDIIVQQPACPRLMGWKLCRYFVEDDPGPQLISAVADSVGRNDFELRPVLREIFSAAEFYSDRVIGSQIKSPIQFLVQSCKLMASDLPSQAIAQNALDQMGQLPFAPPNVKGWDGGKSWISTSTLLFRYNFANYLVKGTANRPNAPGALQRKPIDVSKIVPVELRDQPKKLVAHLARRLFQTKPGARLSETLIAYLKTRRPDYGDETMRTLLHLMMSTPQYQLT